jgi:hypothetical protein
MCPWPCLEFPVGFDRDPSYMTVYNTNFLIRLQLYFDFYLESMFLCAFTRTDLRGVNTTGLGSHTLVSHQQNFIP